ncbi:MipA/OmpV family protein [Croceibacterium aestuarii]|uniref:MipA/OmpV family protein n=1 Tax=Croceibacterium aestuarii TaxID=3064139 RepID=UPI003F71E218
MVSAPANAQDKDPWRYRVAAGAQVKPQYPGADGVALKPMIDVDRARGDAPFEFEAADDSFGFNLVEAGGLEIGPAVTMVSPRKAKDVGAAVPKVARTFEVGAYANFWLSDNVRLHSEARRAVNGHDGWVADGGADVVMRDGDAWLFAIGPRVTWADGSYHDAYYSVTPATSLATGLTVYDARAGIESYGATASADFAFTSRWGVSLYGKYDRLTGDAAASPIVRQYGSRDQFSAGLALSYTFGGGTR